MATRYDKYFFIAPPSWVTTLSLWLPLCMRDHPCGSCHPFPWLVLLSRSPVIIYNAPIHDPHSHLEIKTWQLLELFFADKLTWLTTDQTPQILKLAYSGFEFAQLHICLWPWKVKNWSLLFKSFKKWLSTTYINFKFFWPRLFLSSSLIYYSTIFLGYKLIYLIYI